MTPKWRLFHSSALALLTFLLGYNLRYGEFEPTNRIILAIATGAALLLCWGIAIEPEHHAYRLPRRYRQRGQRI